MKKFLLLIFATVFFNCVYAQIPDGYYDPAAGLSGDELKAALHTIVKNHTDYPYTSSGTDIWDILKESDRDPNNSDNVILLYTGRSVDAAQEYNNTNGWSREHVWAKSHGFPDESDIAYRDAHHLRPCDVSVNTDRGTLDFDNGGSPHSEATDCNYDNDSWEPRDEVKGDIARMMFYMVVRYEGDGGSADDYDLELVDYVNTSGVNFGKLSALLQWNQDDPVDDFERNRNEVVFSYQNNRNPFVDHPEYVDQIWGNAENNTPAISYISINPEYPSSSDDVDVSATITDANGTIVSAELHWGTSSGALNNTIAMSVSSGDTYITDYGIPAQTDGTVIYYKIKATDNDSEVSTSSERSYTVDNNPTITLLDEDFETAAQYEVISINGWTTYIEEGTETWEERNFNNNSYASMSAYNTGEASNITWLLSPEIDLTNIETATFSFSTKDGYNNGEVLTVLISTNYTGTGDPNTATWTTLSPTIANGASSSGYADNFTASGDLDISSYCGNTVYVAYKYTGGDEGITTTMQVDDVLITGLKNQKPIITNIDKTPANPAESEDVTVSATITDADGTIASANLKWGTTTGTYPNTEAMTNSGDSYSAVITGQTAGTTIYYIIDATDDGGELTQSDEKTYTVNAAGNNLPVISDISFSPTVPSSSDSVIVTATITDSDGTTPNAVIKWGTTTGIYIHTVSMGNDGTTFTDTIPTQTDRTNVYFIIHADDGNGGVVESAEQSYTVDNPNILPSISNISIYPTSPESTDEVRVTATVTDSDGIIETALIKWGTTSGTYTGSVTMTGTGTNYVGLIPAQADGTQVYYIVSVEDNEGGLTDSDEQEYIVDDIISPEITNVSIDPTNPTSDDAVDVSATITDSDGTVVSVELNWGLSSGSLTNTISMSVSSGDTYITDTKIPAQSSGETVYYQIVASDNDAAEASHTGNYQVSSSSSIEGVLTDNFKIYPNPASDFIHIQHENYSSNLEIVIYDVIGSVKYSEKIEFNNEYKVNLPYLDDGIYFINFTNDNILITKKIIIKK